MKRTAIPRLPVLAAVDAARLDLEAAAEAEHRARSPYEEAIAAAVAAIGVTVVSRECEMSRPTVHAIVRRVASRALRLPPANDGR